MINRITINVTDTVKREVADKSGEMSTLIEPFETDIAKDDLKSLSQIADGRLPFVEKCADYAVSEPEHVPASMLPNFKKM